MALKGIDISNWQAGLDAGNIAADFVIAKATEGVGFVDHACDTFYQQALSAGKLVGVYHFARNSVNSAEAEVDFFINNIRGYLETPGTLFVLDWEDATHDVAWAKRWLDLFKEKTGKKALIYMSESVVLSHDWSSVADADYGLWVARYRDNAADYNYDMSNAGPAPAVKWWKFYAMWQWTSSGRLDGWAGNLDCNEFYGDANTWRAYAGATDSTPAPAPQPAPQPSPAPASDEVYTVQSGDTLSGIAALFGTTWRQLAADNGLQNANLIYPGQQIRVRGGAAPAQRTYTVQRGDTLSGIAAQNGTDWQTLQAINGIPDANLIYPGQVLRLP